MSGISDIIAYGFGSWSTVSKLPTLGFNLGEVAATFGDVSLTLQANTIARFSTIAGTQISLDILPNTTLEFGAVSDRQG